MSIFGKIDAESVSSNPFKVDRGIYPGEVTKFEFRTTSNGNRQLFLETVIEDSESEFDGERVNKTYFLPDDDMDAEKLETLPSDERRRVKKNMATIKKDLCGEPGNITRRGLGIDPNDLNDPNWSPSPVVGSKVIFGVNNYKENSNIAWINLRDE